ncbi:hypothetical protein [Citrobacter freundii]|uniref:hypothetical protein n=1 Tax=Citrobacter freundii TaxID=546 RepID=UPI0024C163F9|nr:hypothetical protein [Citrobacter freundii]WHW81735.1 hypothetical protein PXV97_16130 [Citrobacter freundii]WHW90825.1 hypothetical protein P0S03_16180 [Citrobacter freundii]
MSKYITMSELALRYGYTLNGIKSMRAEGLPYEEKKGIPEKEGTLWMVQNRINPMKQMSVKDEFEREKLREQIAKADLATYTAQEKSEQLIPVEYVQSELNRFCADLKSVMRLIPNKHAIEILESASDVQTVKETLKRIIDDTLNGVELFEQELNEDPNEQDDSHEDENESEQSQDMIEIN